MATAESTAGRGRAAPPTPPRRDRGLIWLVLVAALAAASLPMLIDLDGTPVLHARERRAVAVSVDTWRAATDPTTPPLPTNATGFEDTDDYRAARALVPTLDGRLRFDAPPGLPWMHRLAFSTLGPAPSDESLLLAARLVSVAMGLLAVACVLWAGYSIGGLSPACLSAVALLGMPAFLVTCRLATPDAPHAGLSLLSLAAALWAIRPHRGTPSRVRQGLGWLVCGLALGGATLVAGPVALPLVIVPLVVTIALCPHRAAHLIGLFAAMSLAMLITAPWAVYVHSQDPAVWLAWRAELFPDRGPGDPGAFSRWGDRMGGLLVLAAPMTLWLIASVMQPFSTSSEGVRPRMFIGWAWFVAVGVLMLSLPRLGDLHPVILVLPAAAVVVGQMFRRYVDLSGQGRHVRLWRWLRWPYLVGYIALGLLLPLAAALQGTLVADGWLDRPIVAEMGGWYWALGAAVLCGLAVITARHAWGHYPGRSLAGWAGCTLAALVLFAVPLVRGPLVRDLAVQASAGVGLVSLPSPAR